MEQLVSKAEWRARFADQRASMSPDARRAADRALCEAVMALPAFRSATVIGGYAPIRGEIDLTPVWQAATAAGKAYALPCTVTGAAEGRMVFRAMTDFAPDALTAGRFGIPEPPDTARILRPSDWEGGLLIVPALGFDDAGFRVGYGGGYYDRFLEKEPKHPTIALCFDFQMVDELETEEFDIPVDIVLWA